MSKWRLNNDGLSLVLKKEISYLEKTLDGAHFGDVVIIVVVIFLIIEMTWDLRA